MEKPHSERERLISQFESPYFSERIEVAKLVMEAMGTNSVKIPQGLGYVLVKAESADGRKREDANLVVHHRMIGGEKYLICVV